MWKDPRDVGEPRVYGWLGLARRPRDVRAGTDAHGGKIRRGRQCWARAVCRAAALGVVGALELVADAVAVFNTVVWSSSWCPGSDARYIELSSDRDDRKPTQFAKTGAQGSLTACDGRPDAVYRRPSRAEAAGDRVEWKQLRSGFGIRVSSTTVREGDVDEAGLVVVAGDLETSTLRRSLTRAASSNLPEDADCVGVCAQSC